MNIVLIGFRCSGKTSVGRILAPALARRFVDLDRSIEIKAGCSIHELVRQHGWKAFRELERQAVRGVADSSRLVIATGGGVVVDERNVRDLKKKGWLVWLQTDCANLVSRMKGDEAAGFKRPSLTGFSASKEIVSLLEERTSLYEKACDLQVNTDSLSVPQVAAAIMAELPDCLRSN